MKVVTGGTLARKYLKQTKPDLVIAIACERDLLSGIMDVSSIDVYGIFNIIRDEDCIDTGVSIMEVERVIKKIRGIEEEL